MRIILIALALASGSLSPASAASLPDVENKTFVHAREMMLKAGWAGGPGDIDPKRCAPRFGDMCAVDGSDVMWCRDGKRPGCRFVYWIDDSIAFLDTEGDLIENQRVRRAHILTEAERRKYHR